MNFHALSLSLLALLPLGTVGCTGKGISCSEFFKGQATIFVRAPIPTASASGAVGQQSLRDTAKAYKELGELSKNLSNSTTDKELRVWFDRESDSARDVANTLNELASVGMTDDAKKMKELLGKLDKVIESERGNSERIAQRCSGGP